MVTLVRLLRDWGDPDDINTQTLKIVQLLLYPVKSSSTIVAEVATGRIAVSFLSKPISEELEAREREKSTAYIPANFVVH